MFSKAISAQALGGEADTIAVASPLQSIDDNVPKSSTKAAVLAAAAAMLPATGPSEAQVLQAGADSTFLIPPSSAMPADSIDSVSGSDHINVGLHSPPDSNNAIKLDGCGSDSELSDLDDEALTESLLGLQSDAGATATSMTTPTAIDADAVCAAYAPAPLPSTIASSNTASDETAAASNATAEEAEDIGDIEPDHYSGTVPVFRPSMHQFRDFKKFVRLTLPPPCFLSVLHTNYLAHPLSFPVGRFGASLHHEAAFLPLISKCPCLLFVTSC